MTGGVVSSRQHIALTDVAGHPVPLHYGDAPSEYSALRTAAIVVDRGHRGRMRVDGPRAAELVTGLVTNDVLALTPGTGQYAAALTSKGKVVADLRIFAIDDGLLIDTSARAWPGWLAMAKKFLNPRLAPHRDVSDLTRTIGVYGAHSRRIVSRACDIPLDSLAGLNPYDHMETMLGDGEARIARVPDIEIEGYDLFVPAERLADTWQLMLAAGAIPAGLEAWEIARIEAGRPEWGVDMNDSTLSQEANLEELHAISFTKGCYVGQEVVARIHFRGHVNRHLRGLLCGQCDAAPVPASLFDDSGTQVGEVRSSALSPRLGAVALAMIRREVEPGTTLSVRWSDGESRADVTRLPFPL